MHRVTELDGLYPGETLWVVGRGPSLANLRACHIGEGPVVAINQAIERVEDLSLPNPIYSMQKDVYFFPPKRAALLLHIPESARSFPNLAQVDGYLFDCQMDFGMPWNVPSVVACAGLAVRMGCRDVTYLCCDAATDGITAAYGQPATEPQAYLMHGPLVKQYAQLPVEWMRVQ